MRREIVLIAGAAALALLAGCGCSGTSGPGNTATNGGSTSVAITGAGSTFVNPAMSKWAYTYGEQHPGTTINYQSVGSGAGIAQYKAGTVDFGATDAPLSDKDLAEMPTPTIHVPVVSGCVVLAYNVPGIGNGLKLSGDVIADIFLGKIKKWNDPRIASQNADLKLPSTPIAVAHRSDGSGTSYIFTDYLCAVSPEWKAGPGLGKTVNWPTGVGGKGNEGVAGLVKQTPGGVGYVEFAYAIQAKLSYGPVKNKSGEYVQPSIESTSAAANAAADKLKLDVRTSIVDGDAMDAYPIVGFTYVLLSKEPKDAAKSQAVIDFLTWALGEGQKTSAELQYGPLPQSIADLNLQALKSIQPAGK